MKEGYHEQLTGKSDKIVNSVLSGKLDFGSPLKQRLSLYMQGI